MAWHTFLDPILNPVLSLGPFWAILVLSLAISFIITIVYKLVTDQKKMKSLKEEQKEYQKKMKELKSQPEEMIKVQKEAMKKNMEYMKQSFKPTLITMIPIIIIFGWMNAHLAFEPIYPGETYSVSALFEKGVSGTAELIPDQDTELLSDTEQNLESEVTWRLKSNTEGPHLLEIKYNDRPYTKKVLISKELAYAEQFTTFPHSDLKQININYNKLQPLGPDFSLFGWKPGWLGLYIIFSIIFSMALRKALKIY